MGGYQLEDSGVQWLGRIPSHWKVAKTKNLTTLRPSNVDKKTRDDEVPVELCNYVDVYYNDFIDLNLPFMQASATEGEIARFSLEIGDVIITKDSEDPMDIAVPALVREIKPNLLCGYHLTMLKSKLDNFSGAYLFWSLKDESVASQLHREATGVTRWAISSRNIKNIVVALPSFEEQKCIANYLDQTCKKINRALEIKNEQLESISAYYESKILEFIRVGQFIDTEMEDSGSEWLGQVPKHWKVTSVKRVTEIMRGKFSHRPRNDPKFYNGQYPFIQTGDVTNADKYITDYSQTLNDKGYGVSKEFPAGTLTMTIAANVGDVAILDFDACFPDSIIGFKPQHMISVEYLYYMFLGLRQDFLSTAIVTTQLNLNIARVGAVTCAIPPEHEQVMIVEALNELKVQTDELKGNIQKQIDTLTNYRKSLIHECVTGKKRVYFGQDEAD